MSMNNDQLASELLDAAKKNDLSQVKNKTATGLPSIRDKNTECNAFHYAAEHLNVEMMNVLAIAGIDIHAENKDGQTPANILNKKLLATTKSKDEIYGCIRTFASIATDKNKVEKDQGFSELLLRTVESISSITFNYHSNLNHLPLDLVKKGAMLGSTSLYSGRNALHWAVLRAKEKGSLEFIRCLLDTEEKQNQFIDSRTNPGFGGTPFDIAFNYHSGLENWVFYEEPHEVIFCLLECGANPGKKRLLRLAKQEEFDFFIKIIEKTNSKYLDIDLYEKTFKRVNMKTKSNKTIKFKDQLEKLKHKFDGQSDEDFEKSFQIDIDEVKQSLVEKNQEISSLNMDLKNFKDQMKIRSSEIQQLESTCEKQKNEITELNKKLDVNNVIKSELENKISELDEKSKQLSEDKKQLTSNASTQLDEKTSEVHQLKQQIKQLEKSLSDNKTSYQQSEIQLKEKLKQQEQKLSEKNKSTQSQKTTLADKDVQIKELQNKIKQHEQAISERDKSTKISQTKISERDNKIKELEGKIKQVQASKEKTINEQKTQLNMKADKNKLLQNELNGLKNQHQQSEIQIQELNKALNDLSNQQFELSEENNALKAQLEMLEHAKQVTSSLSTDTLSILKGIDDQDEYYTEEDQYNPVDPVKEEPSLQVVNKSVQAIPLLHDLIRDGKVQTLRNTIAINPPSVNRLDNNGTSPLYCALFESGNKIKKGFTSQSVLPSCRLEIIKLLLNQPQLDLGLGSEKGTILDLLTGNNRTKILNIATTTKSSKESEDPNKEIFKFVCQRRIADLTCGESALKDLIDLWEKLSNAKEKLGSIMSERGNEVDQLIQSVFKKTGRKFPKLYDSDEFSMNLTNTCALASTIYEAVIYKNITSLSACGFTKNSEADIQLAKNPSANNALTDKIAPIETILTSLSEVFEVKGGNNNNIDPYWNHYCDFIGSSLKIIERWGVLLETQTFNPFQQEWLDTFKDIRDSVSLQQETDIEKVQLLK